MLTNLRAVGVPHTTARPGLPHLLGWPAAEWTIDPTRSTATITVRYLLGKARVRFRQVAGTIHTDPDPRRWSAAARIDADSLETGDPHLDDRVRGAEFLHTREHPAIEYHGGGAVADPHSGDYRSEGLLTVRGITRATPLTVTPPRLHDVGPRALHAVATTTINRRDFGVHFIDPLDGGFVVGDRVHITLDIHALAH